MMSRDKEYVDNVSIAVLVTLIDGSSVTGSLQKPRTRSLVEYMNNEKIFIEIERKDGSQVAIAKNALRTIEATENTRADHLSSELKRYETLEPYAVLGVKKDAPKEAVREAYLKLQRLYHPDRYIGSELPAEITDYIGAVARRINIAYSLLSERGRNAH